MLYGIDLGKAIKEQFSEQDYIDLLNNSENLSEYSNNYEAGFKFNDSDEFVKNANDVLNKKHIV